MFRLAVTSAPVGPASLVGPAPSSPGSAAAGRLLVLEMKRSVVAMVMPVLSTSWGTKRDRSMSWTSVESWSTTGRLDADKKHVEEETS